MSNVAETFKGMQSKFNPSAAAGLRVPGQEQRIAPGLLVAGKKEAPC